MNKDLYVFIKTKNLKFDVNEKGEYVDSRLYIFKPYPKDSNFYYYPKKLTYDEAVEKLIRRKYTENDELGFSRKMIAKPEETQAEFNEYNAYVEECIAEAKEFRALKESWNK